MSCSKPLPPFTFDVLRYLNRDQLERFLIVCRPLKNFIERYFSSKPYRIFDRLEIRGGSYALSHNYVQWHPNRYDYSAQQFLVKNRIFDRLEIRGGSYALSHNYVQWHPNQDGYNVQQFFAGQQCSIDELKGNWDDHEDYWPSITYYSFVEMRPYLGPTVRIMQAVIHVGEDSIYNPEQIEQMESIAYIWRDGTIYVANDRNGAVRVVLAKVIQPILNSPIILRCQRLEMLTAHFSFNDYNVLYTVKVIETWSGNPTLWQQFLEKPGVKPVITLCYSHENIDSLLNQLSKAFSSAVSPNAFKIVFVRLNKPLTEFRETNNTSREKLELKKGFTAEYQYEYMEKYHNYILERSDI